MEDFFNGFEEPEQLDLKRNTIDIKLIIGVLIILFSLFLSAISGIISLGGLYSLKYDIAYSIGYLMGPVIICGIISAIIIVIGKNNRGRNLLIFSIFALLISFITLSSSISSYAAEKEKEKVAVAKMVSLVKDLYSEKEFVKEDISGTKYGKSAPLVEIVQNTYLGLHEAKKDNELIVAIMNDPSTFSKETLRDLNKIKEKTALLDKTITDIDNLGIKANNLLSNHISSIENIKVSPAMKEELDSGLSESLYEATETVENNLNHMKNVIKCMKSMLVFLEENQGAYTFEGEQLVFYKDNDVSSYNKLFEEYKKAIDENNKNYINVQKNVDEKIKEMEKLAE